MCHFYKLFLTLLSLHFALSIELWFSSVSETTPILHFPSVGGIDSLTNKTHTHKNHKNKLKSTWMTKEEMPLMKTEWDACETKRKLSRGVANWRNRASVRVTLKRCVWRALTGAMLPVVLQSLSWVPHLGISWPTALAEPSWLDLCSQKSRWFILYPFVKSWILLTTITITLYCFLLKLSPPCYFWLTSFDS